MSGSSFKLKYFVVLLILGQFLVQPIHAKQDQVLLYMLFLWNVSTHQTSLPGQELSSIKGPLQKYCLSVKSIVSGSISRVFDFRFLYDKGGKGGFGSRIFFWLTSYMNSAFPSWIYCIRACAVQKGPNTSARAESVVCYWILLSSRKHSNIGWSVRTKSHKKSAAQTQIY